MNLVVNNAGVAVAGTVEETSLDDFEWLMNINFWGVVYGTKAFLPHLKASGEGHIVNLSSVFGLVIIPAQSAYNSANSACAGSPTRCAWNSIWSSAVCRPPRSTPKTGGIKTNIAGNARMYDSVVVLAGSIEKARDDFDKVAISSPENAAKQIVEAVRKNKRRAPFVPTPRCSTTSRASRPA